MLHQLPAAIRPLVENLPYTVDSTGCSGAQVLCFPEAVLKIRPDDATARRERTILSWLEGRIPAPRLIAAHQEAGTDYTLMTRIHGRMLCAAECLDHPARLCELMAQALHMLWNSDIADCPHQVSLADLLKDAEARVTQGLCPLPDGCGFDAPEALLHWLRSHQPEEQPVLAHGDFCLPNVLADRQGVCGFIDLGDCGVADMYLDIHSGYRSMIRNLNGYFGGKVRPLPEKDLLFRCLGIAPDWDRIDYYELLDQLLT